MPRKKTQINAETHTSREQSCDDRTSACDYTYQHHSVSYGKFKYKHT